MLYSTIDYEKLLRFYKDKRVFVSGHTGFKGTWLSKILLNAGAKVCGYSLDVSNPYALFMITELSKHSGMQHIIGDIRDLNHLKTAFDFFHPDIVFHLAAQPIVRDSYRDPIGTYNTNVMGTVNILECIRLAEPGQPLNDGTWDGVRSFLNITTDKVYKNNEWEYGYRENDPLDGFDPYSNSKSCSELVTHAYRNSFFDKNDCMIAISTARAGNVIGGGDFANDRIIPDCVRAMQFACQNKNEKAEIIVRNPYSIRPYQHVLEALFAYLMIARSQYEDKSFAGYYNVGPDECDCVTTGELVNLFCEKWNRQEMADTDTSLKHKNTYIFPYACWHTAAEQRAPHEADFLKLDTSRLKKMFHWRSRWHIEQAMEQTVRFSKILLECTESGGYDTLASEMNREIEVYLDGEV